MLSQKDLDGFNEDGDIKANEHALELLGGVAGLEKKLGTSLTKGLCGGDGTYIDRRQRYGSNEMPTPEIKTFISMFLESFEDATLIVLIVSAVVSLIVGVYDDPKTGWIEGTAILFAVFIVAVVTAVNNYSKEIQFQKLNAAKDDINVSVVREGKTGEVNVKELVVGDIIILNAGDRVPADGLFIDGSDASCNESALTGEPEDVKKNNKLSSSNGDMFLLSGSTLSSGYVRLLVTAVGVKSRWGRTKAMLVTESVETPLQEKLTLLGSQIGNFGMGFAGATFVAMLVIRYYYPELSAVDSHGNHLSWLEFIIKAFIMAVTIVVVAVPEGLPLAVTLSLAYSTQKMMNDNNLIRVLAACETMGNATNICSDKTGTLTQNRMTVVESWLSGKFYNRAPTSADLSGSLKDMLARGISLNSTAVLIGDESSMIVSGSKTEGALLLMLKQEMGIDYVQIRPTFDSSRGDQLFTFSSLRKRMSVLIRSGKGGIIFTKGASEVVLEKCSKYVNEKGNEVALDKKRKAVLFNTIQSMAKRSLRTILLAHRSYDKLTGSEKADDLEQDLVLDALFGIKDPLRPDVVDAVKACQKAGIIVRMVTGDNIETAKAIAAECGILTEGGIAMEGPDFRKLTPTELDNILPYLQVLARSSPNDKHTLVTRLNGHALPKNKEEWVEKNPDRKWEKERDQVLPGYLEEWEASRGGPGKGEVVGVTGDGTNDGPALKAADVGLSMGLSGTEVAKEASDIVIMDDNFSSIVKAVLWGRSVFDNIRKFLQFQLTVNAVALSITFISALTGREPPLNAVMMLWVNMIMDTMGALALGTEPPSPDLLNRRPYKRDASLISNKMIRNITIQFLFQMAVLAYLLLFDGPKHFDTLPGSSTHITIIFNTFVFCQVFNEINARSIGDSVNVFKGLFRNPLFMVIISFTVVCQFFIVEYGGSFVKTVGLTHEQWVKCVLLGSLSLPLGALMRFIPVADRLSDFASVLPIMESARLKLESEEQTTHKTDKGDSSKFSLSLLVYLATILVLPLLTFEHFKDHLHEYF